MQEPHLGWGPREHWRRRVIRGAACDRRVGRAIISLEGFVQGPEASARTGARRRNRKLAGCHSLFV